MVHLHSKLHGKPMGSPACADSFLTELEAKQLNYISAIAITLFGRHLFCMVVSNIVNKWISFRSLIYFNVLYIV